MRPGPATFTGLCGVSLEIWGDTAVINGRSGRLVGVGGFRKGQCWGQSCKCNAGHISRV